ncbi:MAG TPA: tripartite tricarboxylate transporter permease [Woeseiaceae bacterium]|nr:tripartite tricarboxylate transporter permease [Woeseiaceae bacterium]
MDVLYAAFHEYATWGALAAIVIGTLVGIVFGALPGLGAVVGITICLPLTFPMNTGPALFLLLGVYCGSMYGGSISSILINTPGTPQAACTALDGFPMAQAGQAGLAVGWATLASVFGGLVSCAILIVAAPQLARVAVKFGSIEVFALIVMALTCVAAVSVGSMVKGLLGGIVGVLLSLVGVDPVLGFYRFDFGISELDSGLNLIAVVVGLFALSEVLERAAGNQSAMEIVRSVRIRLPGLRECGKRLAGATRSALIGSWVGFLPGTGATPAAFISYAVAQRVSRHRKRFGKGEPDGIIAAEASNNAVTGAAMIPTLALGVPGDVVTAILLGAFVVHGITPGVRLMMEQETLVYAIFAALVVVNLVMLVLAFPTVRLFGIILRIRERYILVGVVSLSLIGAASVRGNPFDVLVAAVFGVVGFIFRRTGYPLAAVVIGLVLGPLLEDNLRRGLLLTKGSLLAFFTHSWIATTLFIITGILLLAPAFIRRLGRVLSTVD